MDIPDKYIKGVGILKFINYHHGDRPTRDKSIWTINNAPIVEEGLVKSIVNNKYISIKNGKTIGFNVLRGVNSLKVLGKDFLNDKLYLSKFINQNNYWHGYPVDHKGNNSDKPDNNILDSLLKNNCIDKTEMKRIKKGQPL